MVKKNGQNPKLGQVFFEVYNTLLSYRSEKQKNRKHSSRSNQGLTGSNKLKLKLIKRIKEIYNFFIHHLQIISKKGSKISTSQHAEKQTFLQCTEKEK